MATLPTSRIHLAASHASLLLLTADCSTSANPFDCKLNNILHFLYIAAGILALVLLIVALLAYRTYLQNKREAQRNTRPARPENHKP